jgi:hypothetical protein
MRGIFDSSSSRRLAKVDQVDIDEAAVDENNRRRVDTTSAEAHHYEVADSFPRKLPIAAGNPERVLARLGDEQQTAEEKR